MFPTVRPEHFSEVQHQLGADYRAASMIDSDGSISQNTKG